MFATDHATSPQTFAINWHRNQNQKALSEAAESMNSSVHKHKF